MLNARIFWRISKWSFIAVCVLTVFMLATQIAVPRVSSGRGGCYWTNAMIPYIQCWAFAGAPVATFILNLPAFALIYWPLFALYGLVQLILLNPMPNGWAVSLGLLDGAVVLMGLLYPYRLAYLKWWDKKQSS